MGQNGQSGPVIGPRPPLVSPSASSGIAGQQSELRCQEISGGGDLLGKMGRPHGHDYETLLGLGFVAKRHRVDSGNMPEDWLEGPWLEL